MSASETVFRRLPATAGAARKARARTRRGLDFGFLFGMAVAAAAAAAAATWSEAGAAYFLQPRGAVMVLGGTLGVAILTTPWRRLWRSIGRLMGLLVAEKRDPQALMEEILHYARVARFKGLAGIEDAIPSASHPFLREALGLALEVENRQQLAQVLETRIRVREQEGEADARTLEVAGSFAPTLGILGTVMGLMDVLKNFSDLASVGAGIAMAFVSTMYGLGMANLVLLPAAHRIRARVAEDFDSDAFILEGVLCLYDQSHPALARQRLEAYLRGPGRKTQGAALRGNDAAEADLA
ncbi:MAG: MotA/TolQ/ExbB proton channel family protein [Bryobacteraceae bacterium]|nr:MotA/TolQ/ExbB proton channel family protein [Bryobacteraceae bacterium]